MKFRKKHTQMFKGWNKTPEETYRIAELVEQDYL